VLPRKDAIPLPAAQSFLDRAFASAKEKESACNRILSTPLPSNLWQQRTNPSDSSCQC
jgi:hypothetical protein